MRRRAFLASAGGAAILAYAPGALAQPIYQRRNVATMDRDDPDLVALRDFARMAGALEDRMSIWRDLANIHEPPGEDVGQTTPASASWHTCQHGTAHFFPWHRAYLLLFESMVRLVTGRTSFALPYWDGIGNPKVPPPFREPTYNGADNALYSAWREKAANDGDDLGTPPKRSSDIIEHAESFIGVADPAGNKFGGFGGSGDQQWSGKGELDSGPHGHVHGAVGGGMGWPDTAARDPLFWLHHANVDRLWEVWLHRKPTRVNPPDRTWRNKSWTFNSPLSDRGPRQFRWQTRDLLQPHAIGGGLAYSYDDEEHAEIAPAPRRGTPPRPSEMLGVKVTAEASPLGGQAPLGGGRSASILAQTGVVDLSGGGARLSTRLPTLPSEKGPLRFPEFHQRQFALVLTGVRATSDASGTLEIYSDLPDTPGADLASHLIGSITTWEIHGRAPHGEHHHDMLDNIYVFPLPATATRDIDISFALVGVSTGEIEFASARIVAVPSFR